MPTVGDAPPPGGASIPPMEWTGTLVGASVMEVAVPPGTRMAGFAARDEASTGVHDPLTVRALVLGDACWITVDVCGLDESTCRSIAESTPVRSDRVVVSATHTHSGPCSMPTRLGGCDPDLLAGIVDAASRACREAVRKQEPCTARYQPFLGIDVARNRRHPEIPIDPELQVLVFAGADGSIVAWLVQYPCHPVVLGADNRMISGDYPAFTRSWLEEDAPGSVALFLTGAAGDVNTGHSAESSFSQGGSPMRTFAEAERIGTLLARAAQSARWSGRILSPDVDSATAAIELELERLDDENPAALRERWTAEMRTASRGTRELLRVWGDWAALQPDEPPLRWTGTITVLRIGDVLLVALPGEPFLACAERIQREFRCPVIVAGYSNGCPGYFPTAGEYDFGGYEVIDAHRYYGMPAPFARGTAEIVADTAVQLGRRLT